MKKSLFILSALAAFGLAACGGTGGGGGGGDVPTEEGKITFYFEMASASVEMTEYTSVWMTGGLNAFATGYSAFEMTKKEGTNTYYTMVDATLIDPTKGQWDEYQLLLGYNKTAKMPDGSSGLQWVDARKSDECYAARGDDGLQNLHFEIADGAKTVNLGTHTFSTALPKPTKPLTNYKFKVEFEEAVPEYGKVLIFGSFPGCGWTTPSADKTDAENTEIINAAEMTPDATRKVFTRTFTEMIAGSYECKILVEYTTATTSITWNAIDQTAENYNFTITQADGDGYTLDILGGTKATFKLADPSLSLPLTVDIVNGGTGALKEGRKLGVTGDFTGWAFKEATKVDDNKYTFDAGRVTSIDFGVMSDISPSNWGDKAVPAAGGNIHVDMVVEGNTAIKVTVTCDFSLFATENGEGGYVQQLLSEEQIVVTYANA